MFSTEDISSLPVPNTKLQEAKSDNLGQLIESSEIVAQKIKSIHQELLMEIIEQINVALVRVFNLSLK